MPQMNVWLRWSASVGPRMRAGQKRRRRTGEESSVGNRGNVCFLLTNTYHECPRICAEIARYRDLGKYQRSRSYLISILSKASECW